MLCVNLKKIHSYSALETLLKDSTPAISWWGGRNISIPGYRFAIGVDQVANHIFKMVRRNYEFSLQDRKRLGEIEKKIDLFYAQTEKEYDAMRPSIKKLLFNIRNIFFHTFFPQGNNWRAKDDQFADLYTFDQYVQTFHTHPTRNAYAYNKPKLWRAPV